MAQKLWIKQATAHLETCLRGVPHEINELDWKAALSGNTQRLAEHLMAFANYPGGGWMVFGVSNEGVCQGVSQEDVERIANQLANIGRDALEPPLALDHAVVEFEGVHLLLVYIPEQSHKPVHRRGRPLDESYIRSLATTRPASRQEVGLLMMHSRVPCWEEQRASELMPISRAINCLALDALAALLQRPMPSDEHDLVKWMEEQGWVVLEGSGCYITNLGVVAGAKDWAQFPALERKRLRVIRYRGTNKVETISERSGNLGYAAGFEGLLIYLKQLLPHSEVIQQALRTEVAMYPEIALRELIANALIHQDFSVTGAGPMVEIYDDRIEITNPGQLLPGKRLDRLIGTTPESRNERLAYAFRQYRICEERGTGFQKVVAATELFGLPPISFAALDNSFRVTLASPKQFADMSGAERIEAAYQHAALRHLSSQRLTNTSLRERFKLAERQRNQVTNLIADCLAAGKIKRADSGEGKKFAEYLPNWA